MCISMYRDERILCLDLHPIPKMSHYAYADIQKFENTWNLKHIWPHILWLRATPPEGIIVAVATDRGKQLALLQHLLAMPHVFYLSPTASW